MSRPKKQGATAKRSPDSIAAEFARQQQAWLGPHPRPEVIAHLQEELPQAIEALQEQRLEWARLCSELADSLKLMHVDEAVKQLALHLLDAAGLRDVHTIVCSPWLSTEVPASDRRAVDAAFQHTASLVSGGGSDLDVVVRGLRAAAAALVPAAPEHWRPTAHQALVLAVLKRDGRLRAGDLWERISPKHVELRAHQVAMKDLVRREVVRTAGKARAIEYWLA